MVKMFTYLIFILFIYYEVYWYCRDNNNVSRRRVLKSISAVSITGTAAMVGFSNRSVGEEASKLEVRKVRGRERQNAINKVRLRSEFRRLKTEFDEYDLQVENTRAVHVTEKNGDTRYAVLFPLERNGVRDGSSKADQSKTERYLVYNGVDSVSDRLINSAVPVMALYEVDTRGPGEDKITKHSVQNGSIVTHEAETQLRHQTTEGPSAENVETESCSTCYHVDINCSSINYGCALLVAGAYVTTFTACAVCVGSAGWIIPACGYCLGAVLTSAGTTLICDIGDCTRTSSCVPESDCSTFCSPRSCLGLN